MTASEAVLAELSIQSPRKLDIFIIKKYVYTIEVSKQTFNSILIKASLMTAKHSNNYAVHRSFEARYGTLSACKRMMTRCLDEQGNCNPSFYLGTEYRMANVP